MFSLSSKKAGGGTYYRITHMAPSIPKPRDSTHDTTGFLERTFAEHAAPLTRYATRLLHGDADRARDVVQDTFVKFMAQPVAAVEGHVVEWLFTVCRHGALDVLRKEGRVSRFAPGQAERVVAAEARPGRGLEAEETQAALLALIGKLPANQQEVVRLKFQSGFSYKEISRITELSVTNVGFLIHTAVTKLRSEFAAMRP
jgi:RNA polymerase sigma-70 factor (ECF subfamily)